MSRLDPLGLQFVPRIMPYLPRNVPYVTYGYDSANRLTSITKNGTVVGFAYDDADRRTLLMLLIVQHASGAHERA